MLAFALIVMLLTNIAATVVLLRSSSRRDREMLGYARERAALDRKYFAAFEAQQAAAAEARDE